MGVTRKDDVIYPVLSSTKHTGNVTLGCELMIKHVLWQYVENKSALAGIKSAKTSLFLLEVGVGGSCVGGGREDAQCTDVEEKVLNISHIPGCMAAVLPASCILHPTHNTWSLHWNYHFPHESPNSVNTLWTED